MYYTKLLTEWGYDRGYDIVILKVSFGRGLLMDVRIQSNETNNENNKTYLEKVSKNQRKRRQETLYYLVIYLILKAA